MGSASHTFILFFVFFDRFLPVLSLDGLPYFATNAQFPVTSHVECDFLFLYSLEVTCTPSVYI